MKRDRKKGRAARDDGMRRVTDSNPKFKDQFAAFIDTKLAHGWVGTCEHIRADWKGVQPSHPNAWGACWNAAKRRGLLVELPQQVQLESVKSHARKTHLHRRV